jgi:hypothetical protein
VLSQSGCWSVGMTPTPNNLGEPNHSAEAERVLVGWHDADPAQPGNRRTIALRQSGCWSICIMPMLHNLEERNHSAETKRVLVGWRQAVKESAGCAGC